MSSAGSPAACFGPIWQQAARTHCVPIQTAIQEEVPAAPSQGPEPRRELRNQKSARMIAIGEQIPSPCLANQKTPVGRAQERVLPGTVLPHRLLKTPDENGC